MSWLLLLILIAGWFLTVDSSVSIAYRLPEIDEERGMTTQQKVEFTARFIRGLFGLILIVSAFYMAF